MNLQFCEVVEKAVIYMSDVSGAGVRWQVRGWLLGRPCHTKSSHKRIADASTILQKLRKQLSRPKITPRDNLQPFNRGLHQGWCRLTPAEPRWATTPSRGQKFPASWSSAPMAGFTPAVGKASNILATFGSSSLKRF